MMRRCLCSPSCRFSPLQQNNRARLLSSGWSGASEWTKQKLRNILKAATAEHDNGKAHQKKKKQQIVDAEPVTKKTDSLARLPTWLEDWRSEFPADTPSDRRYRKVQATHRIVAIAAERVLEPSAVALLGVSASVVLSLGAIEATMMCSELSMDAAKFAARYALEQIPTSCVWGTQDAKLIATAMGYDHQVLLISFDPTNASDALTLLNIQLLATARSMAAGFMLLTQLVRVGSIGAAAPGVYEERIRLGREPPIIPREGGLIFRFAGVESDATVTSLRRMKSHLFPVFEDPKVMGPTVALQSEGRRLPVFWCVRPERYGLSYSWNGFPVSNDCFIRTKMGRNVLLIEADATNSDDPLSLGDQALDLTIDDASQGFSRIQELFESATTVVGEFHTMRVFLGNSIELSKSGGGHSFTLRHRIRYAKEVDVLIDSHAPVLKEILGWCDRVVGKDKRVLFQTSNRQYFVSLQLLMRRYGYDIYDPLDWRTLPVDDDDDYDDGGMSEEMSEETPLDSDDEKKSLEQESPKRVRSLSHVLVDDDETELVYWGSDYGGTVESRQLTKQAALRRLTNVSHLPRLVYYDKTAETVNAVQALINAGEVDAANCCALLDKREGTLTLKGFLNKKSELIQDDKMSWRRKTASLENEVDDSSRGNGLHIICSSTIYDDLFRRVRQWTRMGYTASQIQRELDIRHRAIIKQTLDVQEAVADEVKQEEETAESTVFEDTQSFEDASSDDEAKNT